MATLIWLAFVMFASQDALEVILLTHSLSRSVIVSTDLTDVTLVTDDHDDHDDHKSSKSEEKKVALPGIHSKSERVCRF